MSSLVELQQLHVELTAKLINYAISRGYALTWGQTLRTEAEATANVATGAGILHSLHIIKLAVDFSLFKDGLFLIGVEDYRPLGEYWKSLSPLARWGGDFHSPDADHFSLAYGGCQ